MPGPVWDLVAADLDGDGTHEAVVWTSPARGTDGTSQVGLLVHTFGADGLRLSAQLRVGGAFVTDVGVGDLRGTGRDALLLVGRRVGGVDRGWSGGGSAGGTRPRAVPQEDSVAMW